MRLSTIFQQFPFFFFAVHVVDAAMHGKHVTLACVRLKTECDQYAYAHSVRTIVTCAMRDANAFFTRDRNWEFIAGIPPLFLSQTIMNSAAFFHARRTRNASRSPLRASITTREARGIIKN